MLNFKTPLLARAFGTHTKESWAEFLRSLITTQNSNESKTIPGVSFSFNQLKTTVRINREPKLVTRDEISVLATEYAKSEAELLLLLKTRKIEVTYVDNDARRADDAADCAKAKADAKLKRVPRKRKAAGKDKLQLAGHDSHLPTQSAVQPGEEPKK